MKSRFSQVDCSAIVSEFKEKIVGLRLANVYDLSSKIYLFKFSKTDFKEMLLVESGMRMHLTEFAREKGNTPSNFAMKLRKHLRNRKLQSIEQLGIDRIVDFQFGMGENTNHLIIEFYAAGNIILTDFEYKIIALLRQVSLDGENQDVKFAVGQEYPYKLVKQFQEIELGNLVELISNVDDSNKKPRDKTLKKLVNSACSTYGSALVNHCFDLEKVDGNMRIDKQQLLDDSELTQKVLGILKRADEILKKCMSGTQKGFIIGQNLDFGSGQVAYQDFTPYQPVAQDCVTEFSTFNAAVDEFFSKLESQKAALKIAQAEKAAQNKLDAVKQSQLAHVEHLDKAIVDSVEAAQVIQDNVKIVDDVTSVVCGLLATGMDWKDLDDLIKEEQRKENYLASFIYSLKLENGMILLQLPTESSTVLVEIDIYSSAYSNATRYYSQKKTLEFKHSRTLETADRAIEAAKLKIEKDLKQQKLPQQLHKQRKQWWFEKFLWFVSTENFLCIGGRDAAQNELLVKKYLKKGDIYIHADLHGASSVIVKNPYTADPVLAKEWMQKRLIPPLADSECDIPAATLHQAATMSVCMSKAWDAKVVTSAWWVHWDQVSKTAPSGEYLSTGSFMIRGKKNFLPPVQLVYGFGLLFKLEELSIERHVDERRPWLRSGVVDEAQLVVSAELLDQRNSSRDVGDNTENEPKGTDSLNTSEEEEEEFPDTQLEPVDHQEKEESDEEPLPSEPATKSTETDSVKQKKPVRGKKGKLKKMKKYQDQDEQDREIMMQLLAPDKGPQPKGKKAKAKAEKEQKKAAAEAAFKQSKPRQNQNPPVKDISDSIESLELESNNTSILDYLTGNPLVEDEILDAIPVAGPWSAIQKYKYKIKLTPGSLKRGKAGQQAMQKFLTQSDQANEKELIKQIPEVYVMHTMLGQVRMS